ncbi:unnamed protein product [Scytosiphon promiscuus]
MAIFPRWVGSSISTPKEYGPSPLGRQRHYGAVELAGAGEQVNVNDVVEITDDAVKIELDGPEQHHLGKNQRPHLAQVLCMWEDTFTGAFRLRARRLAHASDIPKDALSRLQEARRAFPDEQSAGDDFAHRGFQDKKGSSQPVKDRGSDVDEVFLTAVKEELDVVRIVKPVTLSVGTAIAGTEWKGKGGPRLTHAFDASSGDFTPVERTDTIAKRARVRHAEAAIRASRIAEETAAAAGGKPMAQSSGWLLPRRRATAAAIAGAAPAESGSEIAATSVADSESEGNLRESSWPSAKALTIDNVNRENGEGERVGDSDGESGSDNEPHETKRYHQLGDSDERSPSARASSRPEKTRAERGDQDTGVLPVEPGQSPPTCASPPATPVVTPPAAGAPLVLDDATVRHGEPVRKRPRRLAMPPAKEDPRALVFVPTRQSKRRPSIAGERKRGRPARATMEGEEQCGSPPRRSLVGNDFQADIPDLLSAEDRKTAAVPPTPGTGAKMVWRSIRNWDPESRDMLASYFDAAKEVVQKKQARSGVAVHVRLGGSNTCSSEFKSQWSSTDDQAGLAGSYAVWAMTNGSTAGGAIRVACSEMAQTEIPASAVQRVQSEEEALAALVKARCTLDAFEPALKILDQEFPESIETWTLSQVRSLEQALGNDFDPERRLHGWAREGMSMDRDDFIDLAHIGKQVPGKTSSQVLAFYYRYLAAAEPLTDVVYGTEAAQARKLEAVLPAGGAEPPPRVDDVKLSPAARLERVGWRTINPASHNRKAATGGPPAESDKPETPAASPQRSASMTKRPRSESRDVHPPEHTLPPATRRTLPLAPAAAAPGSTRESAVAVDVDLAAADSNARSEYERRRTIVRGQHVSSNVPVEVDMGQANGFAGGKREGGADRRSAFAGAYCSALSRGSRPSPDAHALHPRPRLAAAIDSAPASYVYRTDATLPDRVGPSPRDHLVPHNLARSRFVQVGPNGRDGRHIVDGGGESRHEGREAGRSEAGGQPEDDLGFMAPCWRLLEMAKSYLDQDQLSYMRGLIITHVRKPMTRHQLLERADSCLQDQQEVLAAFAKMFDRVDHARAEAQLVPLYQAVKRARATQAEPVSMVSHNDRIHPAMASRTEARTSAPYSPYSQPSVEPRTHDVHHRGRAVGLLRAGSESYSRVAGPAVDTRQQRPMMANPSSGWWREGDRTRTDPYVRGGTGPPTSSYPPAAPARTAGVLRDGRRDRDFDVQGEVMRAWPGSQHPHGPGRWQTDHDPSPFTPPAVPADARPRVPWGNGR